jgi:hypothetical protein
MSGGYKFYGQQISMSDRILHSLTSGEGHMYAILLAQMQSGKSGTYLRIALECILLGTFKKVHIICGSRDTTLREQTEDNLREAIDSFAEEKNIGVRDLRNLESSIKVTWNQDLKKIDEKDMEKDILIINDESHTAQSKGNIPFKEFWVKHGLEKCLFGDFTDLISRNIGVLSVSATSFSECVQNQRVTLGMETDCEVRLSAKNVFIMDPGPTYTGVGDFFRADKIRFESEPISEETVGFHLQRALMDPKYIGKYCIVRTARAELDAPLVERITKSITASGIRVDYQPVYGDTIKVHKAIDGVKIPDSLEFLSIKPRHTTLVHICGTARMGLVLDKTHLGFVYEQSKSPAIDTLLQGLLGRVCGHGANLDVDIYIPASRMDDVLQYIEAVESTPEDSKVLLAQMSPALNVKKGCGGGKHTIGRTIQDKDGKFWKKMVPIKFPYSKLEQGFDSREITHSDLKNLFEDHPEILSTNPDKEFILNELNCPAHSDSISERNLAEKSYLTRGTANNLDIAIRENNRCTDWFTNVVHDHHTQDVKAFTVLYHRSNPKDVYFIGFCPDTEMTPDIWGTRVKMASTLDKCNYNPNSITTETGQEIQNFNGAQMFLFPKETSSGVESFSSNLRQAIERSIGSPDGAERAITSIWCIKKMKFVGIRLYKDVFTQAVINGIKVNLDREYGIKLTFTTSGKWNSNPEKPYFRFSSISW